MKRITLYFNLLSCEFPYKAKIANETVDNSYQHNLVIIERLCDS